MRQQFGRRVQRLDALEQVAQRKPRRQRDVGIVVDDDCKVEWRLHATSVARLSGNEQQGFDIFFLSNWHAACSTWGHGHRPDLSFQRSSPIGRHPTDVRIRTFAAQRWTVSLVELRQTGRSEAVTGGAMDRVVERKRIDRRIV